MNVEISALLNDTCEIFRQPTYEKKLSLSCVISKNVPSHIHSDSLRLKQVLMNLVNNAVKFTQVGEVELGCEDVGERDDRITMKFWVRDTGIGIDKDQQAMLFDAFSQADGSTTRKYGGTGLGLSISKHLVSMMGGTMQVESQVGVGSTFSFTISFEIAEEHQKKNEEMTIELEQLKKEMAHFKK